MHPLTRPRTCTSGSHGHAKVGVDRLVDPKAQRQRELVAALIAGRIIAPEASKLAMAGGWVNRTRAEDLGVSDADEDELYEAMDWLVQRQGKIEKRLARRHLQSGGLVLFDLTSSWFEGVACPLAQLG